jgi:hypothetical protein
MGALQGVILVKARVPFAMARDGLFFSKLGQVSRSTRVPVRAMGLEALWASVLAVSGSFDQLTDFVIFAAWIFLWLDRCLGLPAATQDARCATAVPHAWLPSSAPRLCAGCPVAGHQHAANKSS